MINRDTKRSDANVMLTATNHVTIAALPTDDIVQLHGRALPTSERSN